MEGSLFADDSGLCQADKTNKTPAYTRGFSEDTKLGEEGRGKGSGESWKRKGEYDKNTLYKILK